MGMGWEWVKGGWKEGREELWIKRWFGVGVVRSGLFVVGVGLGITSRALGAGLSGCS